MINLYCLLLLLFLNIKYFILFITTHFCVSSRSFIKTRHRPEGVRVQSANLLCLTNRSQYLPLQQVLYGRCVIVILRIIYVRYVLIDS